MNIPRKHPSISPPVQAPQQPRGTQQQYPFGVNGHQLTSQEDLQQIRSVYTQQQVSQFSTGYPQGTSPHDMNKQPVAAHVSATTGPSPQTGMQTQVMYQPNPQQAPPPRQTTPSFVQPRPSIPQSIRAQRQPMNMASSPNPGQPMYSTPPMQTTMFVHGQPPPFIPGQPQVIIQQGPPPPMQVPPGSYTAQPRMQNQFAISTSQPGTYSMTPSPQPYYQPPSQNSTVYFPASAAPGNYSMQQPQRPLSAPQPLYTSKREKRILRITDPNTGRDINEEIMQTTTGSSKPSTPPLSGPSSLRATPVGTTPPPMSSVSSNPDIAAQFAAQVAATLSTNVSKNQAQQAQFVPAAPQPVLAAVPAPPQANVEQQPQMQENIQTSELEQGVLLEIKMGGSLDPKLEGQPVVPAQNNSGEPESSSESVIESVSESVQNVSTLETTPCSSVCDKAGEDITQVDLEREVKSNPVPQVPDAVSVELVHQPSAESKQTVLDEVEPDQQTHGLDISASESSLRSELNPNLKEPIEPVDDVIRTAVEESVVLPEDLKAQKEDLNREEKVQETLRANAPLTEVEEKKDASKEQSEHDLVATPGIAVPKEDVDSKEPKKKNRKQKLKELNQKGEGKEGSDMDAFTGSLPDVEDVSASEIQTVEVVQDNKEQEENMIEVPITNLNTIHSAPSVANDNTQDPNMEKVMITVEDDKVAEKNEKNVEDKRTEEVEKSFEPQMIEESNPVIKKDKMELKYKYREDQWSPLNPEGKKHYDRSFLLQLQFAPESQEKPDGLPKLPDVILDKPHMRNETNPSGPPRFSMGGMKTSASMPDFTPGFIKASPGGKGPGMGGGRNRSQQKKGGPEPRKVITITHEVKLHTTENAWKPGRKSEKSTAADNAKTEELYKKVRSILNKLAPQRFQTLIQQIMDLEIDSEERLKGTIDLVFEKAIDEPNFSVAYANMCKCMMPLKVPTEKGEMVTFRALLLNRCQKEFEKDKVNEIDLEQRQKEIDAAPEDKKKELIEAKDLAESKAKRRSLGNIRFIGELFKLRMLTEGIMHDCLFKLLRSNDEDSLECLCRLLTTIGKDIDHEKAKPRINQYFMQMDKIVKQKRTSSRVRFMLQDVIDLRANNWVPRREDNNPKTIDQINKEAQHEAIQKAAMIQNVQVPSKRGSRGDRGPRGGPGGAPASEDGWQPVTKTSRNILDPARMKLTKQNVDENIQLGPGGRPGSFGSWGRGSSGGGKTSSQEADRPSAPANRFSALSERPDSYSSSGRMGGRGLTPGRDSSKGRSSGLGSQRGKNVARLSAEQDRDSALAAVRNIVSGGGGRSPMGSRNQSRDNSRNRESQREREFRQAPPCKELSEDEIEKKTKAIMDEFLHLQDYKEAIQCVKELESPKTIYFFVYTALNHVLERSPQARKMTGTLLHDLIKQKIISVDIYLRGVKEVLEYADDMEIDIPMIWKYLGELMGPMVQDGSVPLGFLSAACEPLLRSNKAGILVAEILQEAVHRLGHIKVAEQWKASGLQWSHFLAPNENVTEFLRKRKLEYTIDPQEPRSPDAQTMPISKIEENLRRLLVDKRAANEEVFDWIEANVGEVRSKEPSFIRALMTATCSSAITGSGTNSMKVDPRQIQERLLLLQRYLDHQAELELQALYALQALVHKLEHPPGVLQTFFDTLYDEDIISEDAFNQWETSTDSAEQAGKGVARTSVTQFFTWLREAEEEGQEEN